MKVILDDSEIFELLEKASLTQFDPSKQIVLDFTFEENWHLLLFNPSGNLKGCKLFVISKNNLALEAEKLLIPELLSLSDDDGFIFLKNKSLEIVELLLQDKKSAQLFFDGH